ncbi:MAG: transglycosylase SLT domain-containing protein [Anaerolineae bacterium]|nr:transglycosylase SLT domain-containing protein [Anaerolineae bacterium]
MVLPRNHDRYDEHIKRAARTAGIDWLLLKVVVAQESRFDPKAFRKEPGPPGYGSYGLTQILSSTAARDYGIRDPKVLFDVDTNLRIGADYLRRMLVACKGDVKLALASYNCGPGRVRALVNEHGWDYDKVEPHLPLTTQRYVQKVLAYRDAFAKKVGDGHSVAAGGEKAADHARDDGVT